MGKGRKYIQMDDSLVVFMPLCRLSVQLLRIYMHNLELFFVFPGPRQLHFPRHSPKTAANFLRLSRRNGGKKRVARFSSPHFSLPPFSLVVEEGVALLRKLAVV